MRQAHDTSSTPCPARTTIMKLPPPSVPLHCHLHPRLPLYGHPLPLDTLRYPRHRDGHDLPHPPPRQLATLDSVRCPAKPLPRAPTAAPFSHSPFHPLAPRYNDCLGESRLASRWAWDGSGSGSSRAPLLESEAEREPDRLRRFPLSRVYISS